MEWLGKIPEGWETGKIRHFFQIRKRIAGFEGPPVLSVTQRGIKVKDTESNDGQIADNYSHYQLVYKDDFVMNHMDLLTGYVDHSKFDGVTSPDYRVFANIRESRFLNRYALRIFQLCYHQRIFYALGQGAAQLGRWRLPAEQFNNFVLPVPSLDEQKKIAAFLDRETARIDGLIKEYEDLIALLAEKRQALISHAVTRGLSELLSPDDPEFGQWAKPVKFKDSGIGWLGEIPEGWEVTKIRRISESVLTGNTPSEYTDDTSELPWFTPGDFSDTSFKLSPKKYIARKAAKEEFVKAYPNNSVLVVCIGATLGKIGVYGNICSSNQQINAIVPKNILSPMFCAFQLSSQRNELIQNANMSTIGIINQEGLKNVSHCLPSLSEQKAIVSYLEQSAESTNLLVSETQSAIALLKEHRSALISNAVTGKINVEGLV